MQRTIVIAVLVAAGLSAGCLRKETTHVLYLSADGSVRWSASEVDVYSDEEDPGKRFAEEQAYIGPALLGGHAVAQALKALGPDSLVDTQVIRDERPFHVVTQARFAAIDALLQRMLDALGAKGSVKLSRGDEYVSLRVTLDFGREVEEKTTPVRVLVEESDHLRIVLTQGRFGPSRGFDISDGVSATVSNEWIAAAEAAQKGGRAIELELRWGAASEEQR